jgi:putative transposase
MRQGHQVARCTVERLMKAEGLSGAVRGKKVITTISDKNVERAPDLLKRAFVAAAPNRIWVADFTYVHTFSGMVYVAFVVDTFSRRVIGWSAATNKRTGLIMDALEMGLWQRDRAGTPIKRGELIHHSDAGSQYTSFHLAAHLAAEDIAASIGTVADALDNALMESTMGAARFEGSSDLWGRGLVRKWAGLLVTRGGGASGFAVRVDRCRGGRGPGPGGGTRGAGGGVG